MITYIIVKKPKTSSAQLCHPAKSDDETHDFGMPGRAGASRSLGWDRRHDGSRAGVMSRVGVLLKEDGRKDGSSASAGRSEESRGAAGEQTERRGWIIRIARAMFDVVDV